MTFWLSDDGTPIIKPCLQQVNCFHTYHLANVIVSSLEQSHEMFTIRYVGMEVSALLNHKSQAQIDPSYSLSAFSCTGKYR